jgi:hypothetical protein
MMLRLRHLISNEHGVTLLEMLIGISILVMGVTMVASPATAVLRQNGDWRADLIAINSLQLAAGWVAKDIVNTSVISLVDAEAPVDTMTLDWTDLASTAHRAVYALSGSDLVRTFDGAPLVIGRGVTVAEFSLNSQLVTFTMTLNAASGTTDSKTSTHLLRVLP